MAHVNLVDSALGIVDIFKIRFTELVARVIAEEHVSAIVMGELAGQTGTIVIPHIVRVDQSLLAQVVEVPDDVGFERPKVLQLGALSKQDEVLEAAMEVDAQGWVGARWQRRLQVVLARRLVSLVCGLLCCVLCCLLCCCVS